MMMKSIVQSGSYIQAGGDCNSFGAVIFTYLNTLVQYLQALGESMLLAPL